MLLTLSAVPEGAIAPDTMGAAQAIWTMVEPVHDVTYFAPEALRAFTESGWRGYFAGRAAPLRGRGDRVVTAGDAAADLAAVWWLFDLNVHGEFWSAYRQVPTAVWHRARAWALLFGFSFLSFGLPRRPDDPRYPGPRARATPAPSRCGRTTAAVTALTSTMAAPPPERRRALLTRIVPGSDSAGRPPAPWRPGAVPNRLICSRCNGSAARGEAKTFGRVVRASRPLSRSVVIPRRDASARNRRSGSGSCSRACPASARGSGRYTSAFSAGWLRRVMLR